MARAVLEVFGVYRLYLRLLLTLRLLSLSIATAAFDCYRFVQGTWELRYTREIPFDADEALVRLILENDIGTGRVLVNR